MKYSYGGQNYCSPVLDFASIQVAIKIDQGFTENRQDL